MAPVTGITVRPIRLRDLVRLRGIQSEAESLDQPVGRVGQWTADPWSALPISRKAHKTFVALGDDGPVAVLDLRADPANHRWILVRLANDRRIVELDERQREAAWQELLVSAVRAAGAARAKRLHAAFPESSRVIDALLETGFTMYARESVMMARRLPTGEATGTVRRQDSSDVWSIHQLYHSVTPRPVQYAEALTSNYWDNSLPGLAPTRGYVIENGFEIAAHCRVTNTHGGHILHVMVHPGALELLDTLVTDVVADITHGRPDDVIVCVPGYLQEYVTRLERLGFEEVDGQLRLVKYTAVPRRMQLQAVEELAREFPERVAAGTPTFYLTGDRTTSSKSKRSQPDSA